MVATASQPPPRCWCTTGSAATPSTGAQPKGPLASFTVRPTEGAGPPITAVHAYPPVAGSMRDWRADGAWAVAQCADPTAPSDGAIVAGDLNATLDHPPLRDLGPCVDAAAASGAGAVGTWPAGWPSLLGAPIDHVLVDSRRWSVESFTVLDAHPGSDHRPVFAVLRPR